MDKLISVSAQVAISNRVNDFLQDYCIDDWHSKPHHQHQNFAENHWDTIKVYANNTLNCTGAPPPSTWLLCIMWVCFVMNHLATAQLSYHTPMESIDYQMPDISTKLSFYFLEPVYYLNPSCDSCPSATKKNWVSVNG